MITIPLVWVCSQSGWIVAEVGRQPWVIQNLMPTRAAISDLNPSTVMLTFWLFALIFTALLAAEISIMLKAIARGPADHAFAPHLCKHKEMIALETLQAYWWLIIAVLGAALVFLLFVQGGQTMLLSHAADRSGRAMLVNTLGRKWELSFTTLVVFGGAFFASFPLFLFHELRRRLPALDAHSVQLRDSGCEL